MAMAMAIYVRRPPEKKHLKPEKLITPTFHRLAMGVGGTLEYLCELMTNGRKMRKNRERVETVELKVRMDCDGCELKVKRALSSLTGVKSVEINRKQQKVTVHGYVEVSKVLRRAKSTGKRAEIWPYVPYNTARQPQAYDKKAPPGYVGNNIDQNSDDPYFSIFSEDNPNACSIM